MKRTKLLILSALVAGLQAPVAQAAFPADAEASHDLAAIETYAERMARTGKGDIAVAVGFPADAAERHDLPALETYSDRMARQGDITGAEVWGVSPREPYSVFPGSVSEVD